MTFKPTEDPETGRRTSRELTATRSALGAVNRALQVLEYARMYGPMDPEYREIKAALFTAQGALHPFRRTGRPRKAQEWTPREGS